MYLNNFKMSKQNSAQSRLIKPEPTCLYIRLHILIEITRNINSKINSVIVFKFNNYQPNIIRMQKQSCLNFFIVF